MPLPPLLLDRLKRRKIIREVGVSANNEPTDKSIDRNLSSLQAVQAAEAARASQEELEEEIIAEDYSDEQEHEAGISKEVHSASSEFKDETRLGAKLGSITSQETTKVENEENPEPLHYLTESVIGCPNKYNIYHDCTQYCVNKYGNCEELSPSLEQRKQLALVLKNYPMTNEWRAVYDPGVRTFYFWNTISNLVSWFPPSMNGLISFSADQIRRAMRDMEFTQNEPD